MYTVSNNYFYYLSVLQDCTCNTTVNENGNALCQTRHTKFDGLLNCVVNQPSSCKDLINSLTNSEEKISAEACTDINQGNRLLPGFKHPHLYRKTANYI